MPNKYFRYSVIFLLLYEVIMLLTTPANGSLYKLIVTLLFVASFISLLLYFKVSYEFQTIALKPIFGILIVLLGLGLINTLRSIELDVQTLITIFGNSNIGFAMLLPLAVIIGSRFENILWYNRLSIQMLKVGLFLLPISFFIPNFTFFATFTASFLMIPITLFVYQKSIDKMLIIANSIFIIVFLSLNSGRLIFLQILFLWTSVLLYYLYLKTRLKILRRIIMVSLISLPFIIIISGFSLFEYIASGSETVGVIETTDTRTFLYQELLEDLTKNKELIWGKGAMGKYFSEYFARNFEGGDNENRINVEVGVLSMLLKGGIINLVLNLIIIFIAIYYSFQSKNIFTHRLVFLVICHFLSLFIANLPQYTIFSFTMWIAIGGCVSISVRTKNEKEIISKFKLYRIKYAKPKNINSNAKL